MAGHIGHSSTLHEFPASCSSNKNISTHTHTIIVVIFLNILIFKMTGLQAFQKF